MPHFRTWDDIYYDSHDDAGLGQATIGIGELQTDVALRAASYQISPAAVQFKP